VLANVAQRKFCAHTDFKKLEGTFVALSLVNTVGLLILHSFQSDHASYSYRTRSYDRVWWV